MTPDRFRRPPLSDSAKEAYMRVHFCHAKQEYDDRLMDVYEFCYQEALPFLAIVQPRRYATLEINLTLSKLQLTLPAQQTVKELARTALDMSGAPKKSKAVDIGPNGGVVRGLENDHAKQLAQNIWRLLADGRPSTEVQE